jgi:hypothetical protein
VAALTHPAVLARAAGLLVLGALLMAILGRGLLAPFGQAEPIGRVVFLAGVLVMLAALVLLALDLRRAASVRAPEGVLSSSASDRNIP